MNIGDKVRSMRGIEEGIVTRILSTGEVEVEIEDGFRIPFSRNDLVVVSKQEAEFFLRDGREKIAKKDDKKRASSAPLLADTGIFMAFVPFNDQQLEVHLVNNTDLNLPFIFGEELPTGFNGVAAGGINARSAKKVHQLHLAQFEQWPTLIVQALYYRVGVFPLKEPLTKRLKFKANTFFKQKGTVPVMEKEGYLFQLDGDWKPVSAEEIKEKMLGKNVDPVVPTPAPVAPMRPRSASVEVDLHIEVLLPNAGGMKTEDMLAFQLQVFEQRLDEAIVAGVSEVVFIHGVGNGVLRGEVQKRLSKHPHVEYFKDAKKEKFGYGATMAKIK